MLTARGEPAIVEPDIERTDLRDLFNGREKFDSANVELEANTAKY